MGHQEFRAAWTRFTWEDVTKDGIAFVRLTDPVNGFTASINAAERGLLPQLIRDTWTAYERERQDRGRGDLWFMAAVWAGVALVPLIGWWVNH